MALGWSVFADCYGCKNCPSSYGEIIKWCYEAIEIAGLTPRELVYEDFPVDKYPGLAGASVLALVLTLKESHLGIHTWPEHDFVSIDLYTCGHREKAEAAARFLVEKFSPEDVKWKVEERGAGILG